MQGEDTGMIPPIECIQNDGEDSSPVSDVGTSSKRAMRRGELGNRVLLSSEDPQEAESDVERSSPICTVDAFLKKAMRRPRYDGGRRSRVILSSEGHAELEAASQTSKLNETCEPRKRKKRRRLRHHEDEVDSDYQPSSHETSPQGAPSRCKLPKASFTKRLITAAIMSHVHPIDSLVTGAASDGLQSQRRALHFEPARSVSPPLPHSTWSLTDPRKRDPFRDSSFAKGGPICIRDSSTAAPRKPLSTWQTPWNQIPTRPGDVKLHRRSSSTPQAAQARNIVCPPLVFVPLADAEAMYAASRR